MGRAWLWPAALWYSAPVPKPYIAFVASDVHGPAKTPDAIIVKSMLINQFKIPADFLIMRQKSNCTLLEVRTIRALARVYRLTHIFLITHLYHAPRAQRYTDEVWPNGSVIPVHADILAEVTFPETYDDLLSEMIAFIQASQPGWFDLIRETLIEWMLNQAHTLDHRGRLERKLARILRPTANR